LWIIEVCLIDFFGFLTIFEKLEKLNNGIESRKKKKKKKNFSSSA